MVDYCWGGGPTEDEPGGRGTSRDWLRTGPSFLEASAFFRSACMAMAESSCLTIISVPSSTEAAGGAWKANASGSGVVLSWTFVYSSVMFVGVMRSIELREPILRPSTP